ncbi:MAG: PTS sugar transporter subunit IIA [Spirochaetota bacterium]
MGGICTKLLPENIVLDPTQQGKEDVISLLVGILQKSYQIDDAKQLINDILDREQLASTCLGFGCAVPHAHSSSVQSTMIAAARLTPPQDFQAPDGEPVSLVFLLAGPKNSAGIHIRLLSKLARLLHDPHFRKDLREAEQVRDFYDSICRKDS